MIGKAKSVAVEKHSHINKSHTNYSSCFAHRLFVKRSYYRLRLPRCSLRALHCSTPWSFSLRPIYADEESFAVEHLPHKSLFLSTLTRRSILPFFMRGNASTSRKRLSHQHKLLWNGIIGVCVSKCGKVSDHDFICLLPKILLLCQMQGFQPLFYCINGDSDGSK